MAALKGPTEHVARIPLSDQEESYILVKVVPGRSTSRPLTVRIVATNGMALYGLSCKSPPGCLDSPPLRSRGPERHAAVCCTPSCAAVLPILRPAVIAEI
jgi:hypothetical protein